MSALRKKQFRHGLLATHKSYAKQTAELTVESLIAAGIPALVTRNITRRLPPSDIPPYGDFSDSWFRSHRGPFYLGAGGSPLATLWRHSRSLRFFPNDI